MQIPCAMSYRNDGGAVTGESFANLLPAHSAFHPPSEGPFCKQVSRRLTERPPACSQNKTRLYVLRTPEDCRTLEESAPHVMSKDRMVWPICRCRVGIRDHKEKARQARADDADLQAPQVSPRAA